MVQWNTALPEGFQPQSQEQLIKNTAQKLLISGGGLLLVSKAIDDKVYLLGSVNVSLLLGLISYVLLGLFGVASLQAFLLTVRKPSTWEDSLNDGQRRLLGLRVGGKKPAAMKPGGGVVGARPQLLRPPERGATAVPAVSTTPVQGQDKPFEPSPVFRSGGREISTPEQLQRVLREFDEQSEAVSGSPVPEFAPFSGSSQHSMPTATPYRPSLIPKDAEVMPVRGDGRAAASIPEQKKAAMSKMKVPQPMLEVGVEKLREWFAQDVLQPLRQAIYTAHSEVIESAAKIGMAGGLRLSPLDAIGSSTSVADDSLSVNSLHAELIRRLQSIGNMQPPPEALQCLEALNKYRHLISLLRGEFPAGILPPTPDGYVVSRIQDLAEGTCMMAFAWNSGGRWNGRPWTPDLPTDSALVLYLFAAFLAAPRWTFPQGDANIIEGPSGVLYLGKLPAKVAPEYYAVLPARPPTDSKVTGLIGLQLGSQQPHFSLVIAGKPIITLSDQTALFEVLMLFLVHCRSCGGVIGSRSMEYLGLDEVAQQPKVSWSNMGWEALRATRAFVWPK